jgi:hypothetical protein
MYGATDFLPQQIARKNRARMLELGFSFRITMEYHFRQIVQQRKGTRYEYFKLENAIE